MNRWTIALLAGIAGAMGGSILSDTADAQMGTRPFSFDTMSGAGMSIAGRQAIIEKELFGSTPNVLLKSDDGRLLGLHHGPGSTALVTSPEGEFLPSYRGRGVKRPLRAGEFNEYFRGSSGYSAPHNVGSTTETIDSWTATVISGRPHPGYSSIEQWTSMVYLLER
jgi:hypothetical protein